MNVIGCARSLLCLAGTLWPALVWAGPREEVTASIDKFVAARSFHATIDTTGEYPVSQQVDYVAPDRYRMRMGMGGMIEQILVGDSLYHISPDGRSMKVPATKSMLSQWRDPALLIENAKSMSVTALGGEALDGVATRKYQVDHRQPQPSTMTLWVGGDGYPLQILSSTQTRRKPLLTTIRYSRFDDASIKVDVPK